VAGGAEGVVVVDEDLVRLGDDLDRSPAKLVHLVLQAGHAQVEQGARRGPVEQQPGGTEPEEQQPRWATWVSSTSYPLPPP
jgi:hypothetical protein